MVFEVIAEVLKSFLRGPATQKKPHRHTDSFRGSLVFDPEKCVGCGCCVKVCPAGACKLDRKTKKAVFDFDRCVMCANCVRVCRFSALSFSPENTGTETRQTQAETKQALRK